MQLMNVDHQEEIIQIINLEVLFNIKLGGCH